VISAQGEAARARRRRRRGGLQRLDVVSQRSTAGEHAPVVRVVLVDVAEESFLVLAELLADLARQVVGTRQRTGQLHDIKSTRIKAFISNKKRGRCLCSTVQAKTLKTRRQLEK